MDLHVFLLQMIIAVLIVFLLMQIGEFIVKRISGMKKHPLFCTASSTVLVVGLLYVVLQWIPYSISFLYVFCAGIVVVLNKIWFYMADHEGFN